MTALRAFVTIGVAALWFALAVPPMFMTPPSAYTGSHIVLTGAPIQRNLVRIDRGSPAYRAGLRTGDVLGCLSMLDAQMLLPQAGALSAYRAGTVVSTCVRRNGRVRVIQFEPRAGPPVPNLYGSDALAALRACIMLVFFLTGIALVTARPCLMTWLFYLFCLGNAPSLAGQMNWTILPSWQYAFALGLLNFGDGTAVAWLLLFSVLVPNDRVPAGWRRVAFYIALALAAVDAVSMAVAYLNTNVFFGGSFIYGFDEALTGLTLLVVLARLVTMERGERARFGWAAFAIIFGVVANDIRNVLSNGPLQPYSIFAAYLTVVMPISLMYAILRRHVIDVRFVISRTVVYFTTTTLVVCLIGLVDWATSTYLHTVRVAMALDALFTIGLGVLLHRTYRWLDYAVDLMLFRKKHDAEEYLDRLARTLPFSHAEETVDRALVEAPCEKFELAGAALFRERGARFVPVCAAGWKLGEIEPLDSDTDVLRFLKAERARLHLGDLHGDAHVAAGRGVAPALAVPIFQGNELTGFALYGIHRDGTKIDPDEERMLARLCENAAQAYTGIELAHFRRTSGVALAMEPA